MDTNGDTAEVLYSIGAKLLDEEDEKAVKYFERAARMGSDDAISSLGTLYLHGILVKRDYHIAFFYFNSLACKGDAEHQFVMGQMFGKGDGVPRSDAFSKYWYHLAALQEHDLAIETLISLGWTNEQGEIKSNCEQFKEDLKSFKSAGVSDRELLIEGVMWTKFRIGEIEVDELKKPYGCVHVASESELEDSYFYLAQNIDNLIERKLGARFYDDDKKMYLQLSYGDVCMLKLRGGHLLDYPYGIGWARREDIPAEGISFKSEAADSVKTVRYEEEGESLFPFESRRLIREMMVKAGIEEPKYNLLQTSYGVFIMFNLLEHCNKFDHTEELKHHWGLAIQWVTPRCYGILLINDDWATIPL